MSQVDTLAMQRSQYSHDKRNHFDILSLHKNDRVKHYGLHFAKYAVRLALDSCEKKTQLDTAVDSTLVALSSANTLMLKLKPFSPSSNSRAEMVDQYLLNMEKYCDGCEKIDHGEDFWGMLREANKHLFDLSFSLVCRDSNDPIQQLFKRRKELADRQFYIEG